MEVFLKYWYFGFHFPEPIYKVKIFYLQILKIKIKTFPLGKSLFKLRNKETDV